MAEAGNQFSPTRAASGKGGRGKSGLSAVIPRRQFLLQSTALLSTLPLFAGCVCRDTDDKRPGALPRRVLGRTGMEVSVLSFGGGTFFQNLPDGQWEPLLHRALDLGINYFDSSSVYQFNKANSHGETRFGRILPPYRKSIYVCTKLQERDPEKAKRELEASLKRLQMDYVDVLMVHSVAEAESDVAALEKGIYAQLRKWKDEGVARHIGFSSMMTNGPRVKQVIEVLDPEVVLIAISATKYGSIAENAIPAAQARNTGFLAMKTLRNVVGKDATARELMTYAWFRPGVASICVGHSKIEELEENVRTLRGFAQQTGHYDGSELERRLAHLATPEVLTWARPEYRDGGTGMSEV